MFKDAECTRYATEESSTVYARFNYPISTAYNFKNGENYITIEEGSQVLDIEFQTESGKISYAHGESFPLGSVVVFEFNQPVRFSLEQCVWNYNTNSWYIALTNPTLKYIVISDSDGQFKLPRDNNNMYFAQSRSTGEFVTISSDDGDIQDLSSIFDSIVIDGLDTSGNVILNNGDATTLNVYAGTSQVAYTFNLYVGYNNKVENFLLPDGIYMLDSFKIESEYRQVSFAVIDKKWHLLYSSVNGDEMPISSINAAVPVDEINTGNKLNIRSSNMHALRCNEFTNVVDITIRDIANAMHDVFPSELIGSPLVVSDNGSSFIIPYTDDNEVFDIN